MIDLQVAEEEGSGTPSGSQRSAILHSMDTDGGALPACEAASPPGWDSSGPDVGNITPLAAV